MHEPEAEVVRRAYALRLEGMGVKAICSLLYAEGVRYPRSGGISHFGINHMLANERYAGLIVYRRHEARKDRETGSAGSRNARARSGSSRRRPISGSSTRTPGTGCRP